MKTFIGFLAGGVVATLLVANMTGSFAPRLADQVAPIELTTGSNQASPAPSFEDEHSPEPTESMEPGESAEPSESPDDHGGSNSGPGSSDDNSGSGSDNNGPGSDNSGSGSDNSGPGH